MMKLKIVNLQRNSPSFLYEANDKLFDLNRLVSLKRNHLLQDEKNILFLIWLIHYLNRLHVK